MAKTITFKIDDHTLTVPAGTLIVDAAKENGIDIPVFCYHPKMEPVGMCRMCLVEIGRPAVDRATGKPQLDPHGAPVISFGPKLETACTTPVSDGMVVRTASQKVTEARRDVIEFLLTSHPLDCPVCDKGGECPLQNLTLEHGPAKSRFLMGDKMRHAKHYPLGDLIYLDRERCIQCARCVRFQSEIAGDPVIGFSQRGRSLEIISQSDPGFDSVFSGNTTDICPVGALTSADFRFGARPWEMKSAASICTHCPVGCNLTLNVRREAASGGRSVVKRIMPRQNEAVNETWICDKGRFAYRFAESAERITTPLVRKGNRLVEASWDEAIDLAAQKLKAAQGGLVTLAGGSLANEDLFNLRQLTRSLGGQALQYTNMAGGEWTARVGLGAGSNIKSMGAETAILVVASDLYEEAPLWYLRVKQAAKRGAKLVMLGGRATRLDKFAKFTHRYAYGSEAASLGLFMPGAQAADELKDMLAAVTGAENLVIFFGSDGLGLAGTRALSQACADLLIASGKAGRVNSGLVGVWPKANSQGAFDLGFAPADDLAGALSASGALYIAAADPAGDHPALAHAIDSAAFVLVQELFLTETALRADVVLPAQSFIEREGTFTSGERRVQRFYPAVAPLGGALPDFAITAQIAQRLGIALAGRAASQVMLQIAEALPDYAGLTYGALSVVGEQRPIVGRADLYYGGTGYDNRQGLGVQLQPQIAAGTYRPDESALPQAPVQEEIETPGQGDVLLIPVTRLYDQGRTLRYSALLAPRLSKMEMRLSTRTAEALGVAHTDCAQIELDGLPYQVTVRIDDSLPGGLAALPRSVGIPLVEPRAVKVFPVVFETPA